MTGFKENNEIVVYRESYRIFPREITQMLRNNRRAPMTNLCENFTESGRRNEEDAFEKTLRDRQDQEPRRQRKRELINQTKETTLETLARTVSGWIPDNIQWDGWEKQRSYLEKVFDFVNRKEGYTREEGRKTKGWGSKFSWVY